MSYIHNFWFWLKENLFILPGLWIILWQGEMVKHISKELGSIVLLVIVFIVIYANFIQKKGFGFENILPFGSLFWLVQKWVAMWWYAYLRQDVWAPLLNYTFAQYYRLFSSNPSWLIWSLGICGLLFLPFWVYKRTQLHLQKPEKFCLTAMTIITMGYVFLNFSVVIWAVFHTILIYSTILL